MNKTTVQKIKLFGLLALLALFALAFVGCEDKDDDPPEPTRVFTDIILSGKAITLIDQTGASTDLKARGIWQKFHDAITGKTTDSMFTTKYNVINDFTIIIKSGSATPSVSGHSIVFSEGWLSTANANGIWTIITTMVESVMEV